MLSRAAFNSNLDRLVRPQVRLLRRPWPAFQVCGCTGLALAILLAVGLVLHRGLSPLVMAEIVLAAILIFLGLAMATKIITGKERLIYYHHEIAVMTGTALLLWLWHQPILPYLDATILGLGMFVVCGRIGCLMAGCCHGRPYRWGVCYREEHATTVFTPYYVGMRLFPIQLVESLWVCCIVLVGSGLILSGSPPGTALAWYVVAYDIGRFCFEFVRGDSQRVYLVGFSEAQWTSLILTVAAVCAELLGLLPLYMWHIGVMVCMLLAMILVTLSPRFRKSAKHQLLHPHHIREVAEVVEQLSKMAAEQNTSPADIYIGSTSLGIQISASRRQSASDWTYHYGISSKQGDINKESAKTVAALICHLKHHASSSELIERNQGVFHLFIH